MERIRKSVKISFNGEQFELKLVLNNIRSPDCKAFATDENGTYEVELEEPATYKGKVVGDSDSRVRFTITPDWVSGCVVCDKGYYWIDALNGWYNKTEAGANITHYTYNTTETDTEFGIYLGDDVTLILEDEWDRKRGKSKYYIEQQGNKAKVEVPSNFRVYAKKYDTPQRGKAEINPTEIKESINASFTISFKGTEQKFGHAIYLKDGEEVHEIVPYVPSTYIKVIGDSIDDFPASISLDKVGSVPDSFVEITESDLDKYPILRNILDELERWEGAGGIIYKTGEIKGTEIVNLVQCKYAKKYDTPQWGYYIKYKEDFYSIGLMIA